MVNGKSSFAVDRDKLQIAYEMSVMSLISTFPSYPFHFFSSWLLYIHIEFIIKEVTSFISYWNKLISVRNSLKCSNCTAHFIHLFLIEYDF